MTVRQVEGRADERREDTCRGIDGATTCGCPGSIGAVYRMMDCLKYKILLNNQLSLSHIHTTIHYCYLCLLCSKSKCLRRSGFLEAGLLLAVSGDTPTDALVSLVRLSSRLVEARIVWLLLA